MILYHGGCLDGYMSAFTAHCATGDTDIHPCYYHKPLPDVTGKDVIMVDFGPDKEEDLLRLVHDCKSLLWIDHHVSQQFKVKEVEKYEHVQVIFDTEKSAAALTLLHFRGKVPSTLFSIVPFIQDRDLWQFKYAATKPLCKYIYTIPHTLQDYETLVETWNENLGTFIKIGDVLLKQDQNTVKRLCGNIRAYGKLGVVNTPILQSEIGEWIYSNGYDLALMWYQSDTGYVYSLRSLKVPCNKIAEDFGGGGHKNAAGFSSQTKIKFEDLCGYLV